MAMHASSSLSAVEKSQRRRTISFRSGGPLFLRFGNGVPVVIWYMYTVGPYRGFPLIGGLVHCPELIGRELPEPVILDLESDPPLNRKRFA